MILRYINFRYLSIYLSRYHCQPQQNLGQWKTSLIWRDSRQLSTTVISLEWIDILKSWKACHQLQPLARWAKKVGELRWRSTHPSGGQWRTFFRETTFWPLGGFGRQSDWIASGRLMKVIDCLVVFVQTVSGTHRRCQLHWHLSRWYQAVDGWPRQHRSTVGSAWRTSATATWLRVSDLLAWILSHRRVARRRVSCHSLLCGHPSGGGGINPLVPAVAIRVQHPVPDRVKPYAICNFWHLGTLTLSPRTRESEQNEVDGTKKGADSSGKVMHMRKSGWWFVEEMEFKLKPGVKVWLMVRTKTWIVMRWYVNQESEQDEADSTALLMHITRLLHSLTAAVYAESGFALTWVRVWVAMYGL